MTTRSMAAMLAVVALAVVVPAAPVRAQDAATEMQQLAKVMDLVQAGKNAEALQLADRLVRAHPSSDTYQARAGVEQMMRRHRQAIDDFRRAYGMVREPSDLEGIARSAIAVGDLGMAAKVAKALRTFPYKSQPERARGMRCVAAIAAAAEVLLQKEQSSSPQPVPVSHRSEAEEGE